MSTLPPEPGTDKMMIFDLKNQKTLVVNPGNLDSIDANFPSRLLKSCFSENGAQERDDGAAELGNFSVNTDLIHFTYQGISSNIAPVADKNVQAKQPDFLIFTNQGGKSNIAIQLSQTHPNCEQSIEQPNEKKGNEGTGKKKTQKRKKHPKKNQLNKNSH